MSKFPFAYCKTTQELVEPDDVVSIYVENKEFPYLQCPDENCRSTNPYTEITPVCCNPDKPCKELSPHFRTHVGDEHSPDCPYEYLNKHTDYIMTHKKEYCSYSPESNILKSLNGVKDTSLLPDNYISEFKPISEIEAINNEAQKRIQSGKTKDEAYRIARCCVPHTTSKLSLIIDMAEALEKTNERDRVPLSLPGRKKATYETAFLSLYSLRHDYTTPYILCASAQIHHSYDGLIINYMNTLKYYHP